MVSYELRTQQREEEKEAEPRTHHRDVVQEILNN